MYFVFAIRTRHKSVSRDNGKISCKELFYFTTDYSMMKCCRNVNFKEIYTEPSKGKNDGFFITKRNI